ncbi:hypothetical protein O6H91_13G066600 [Diphasiastrum complanatum]|uniref:Uncharacterized protein n=1 Tax=Diphasiastrum complanatum TaxID=34168 RepID=A0ACC2BVV9_DIPCM|nr:hypothetical protein O6H91_13G066600 [Diphasiastrum complanatum]
MQNQMNRNQMDMGDSEDHVGEAARIRIISNRHQRSCKGHKRSSSQHDMLRLRKQRPCSTVDHKMMSRLLDEDARIYFEKYVSVSRLESAGGEDLTINKRVLQKASRKKPVKNDSDFEATALTKPEIRPVNGDGIVVPWLESENHVTSVIGRFGKVIHDGSDVKFNKQLSYKKGNRKLCIIERWNTAAYAGHSLNARYFDTKCFQSHKFHFKSKVQHGRLLLCGRKI